MLNYEGLADQFFIYHCCVNACVLHDVLSIMLLLLPVFVLWLEHYTGDKKGVFPCPCDRKQLHNTEGGDFDNISYIKCVVLNYQEWGAFQYVLWVGIFFSKLWVVTLPKDKYWHVAKRHCFPWDKPALSLYISACLLPFVLHLNAVSLCEIPLCSF